MDIKIIKCGGKESKKIWTLSFFFRMCSSPYDYQAKANRCEKGLTCLEKQGNHKSKQNNTFTKTKNKSTQA